MSAASRRRRRSCSEVAGAVGARRRQPKRFFELLWLISLNEFSKTFFGTALGYIWSLLRPLMLFGVLLVVFTKIIRFGNGSRTTRCCCSSTSCSSATSRNRPAARSSSVVAQEGIVRKTQFPRLVIPLSRRSSSRSSTSALNLIVVVDLHHRARGRADVDLAAVPADPAPLLMLTAGLSMLLSALYVRFRDIGDHLGRDRAPALFYATPVLYPIETPDAERAARPDPDQPADARSSSRRALDHRPDGARGGQRRGRAGCTCCPRSRSSCASASPASGSSAARRRGSPSGSEPARG